MASLTASVEVGAVDRFSGPAAKVGGAAAKLERQIQAGSRQIEALGRQQQSIAGLKSLERQVSKSGNALAEAAAKTRKLRSEVRAADSPSRRLSSAFERARAQSSKLGQAHAEQRERLRRLRGELREAGIATDRLGDAQAELDRKMRAATDETGRARAAQAGLAERRARDAQRLERFSQGALIAESGGRMGRSVLSALARPFEARREVEAAIGGLRSLKVPEADARAVAERGRDVSETLPGIDAAGFTRAAYDIQSAIDGLSGEGIANLTEAAAVTARATMAEPGQMTDLMATMHGVFKPALHAEASDSEFAWQAMGQLATSVEIFKTTGPKMAQAIESAGDKASLAGIPVAEQLAALGALQGKMDSSRAGTGVAAIYDRIADAEDALRESGRSVRMLDEGGNALPLTEIMASLRREFGDEFTTREQAEVREAFGSVEAAAVVSSLWKLQERHEGGVAQLAAAGLDGEAVVRAMQARMDDNADARLELLGQRWSNLLEKTVGNLVEMADKVAPALDSVISGLDWLSDAFPNLTTGVVVAGAGVAAVAAAAGMAAPSIVALAYAAIQAAAFMKGSSLFGRFSKGPKLPGGMPSPGRFGGIFGKLGNLGKSLLPAGKLAARFGSRAVPYLPAALSAVELGAVAIGDGGEGKGAALSGASGGLAGSLAGGLAGAKLGALLGSVVPGIGTAIGGVAGGAIGAAIGHFGGERAGKWIHEKATGDAADSRERSPEPPLAPEGDTVVTDARRYANVEARITVQAQPGESAEAIARRVMEELERMQAVAEREAAFDSEL